MLELGEYDSINFVLIRYYSQNANFPQRYFPKPIKSLSIPFLKVYIILMGSDPTVVLTEDMNLMIYSFTVS